MLYGIGCWNRMLLTPMPSSCYRVLEWVVVGGALFCDPQMVYKLHNSGAV